MNKSLPAQKTAKKSGFMLMEALIAFSIFGIAVTGIVIALNKTSELSYQIVHDQWIKQEAQNILSEVVTTPANGNDFSRDEVITIDAFTEARVIVEPHETADKDGNKLEDLYTVKVTIYWDNNGKQDEAEFSTIHYAPMFTSQQGR